MLEIALHQDNGPVPIHLIAQRQNLSSRYLEQLLIPLKQAGLVKSVRGSQGGYVLGWEAASIKVGDIIRVLEGPISPVDCVNEVNPEDCDRAGFCVTRRIWSELRDSMNLILDSYTLADLKMEAGNMNREAVMIEE